MTTPDDAVARRLKGRNALITGGATGIGQAIAIRFAREGANVAINYLGAADDAERARRAIRESSSDTRGPGDKDLLLAADISNEAAVKRMFETLLGAWERLDILVNNAGIVRSSDSHELSEADFEEHIGVNLKGAFLCSREAIRHFLSRDGGGVIVNNSSAHQIIPKPKYLAYAVSKSGLAALTASLALEYARYGIRVNAVGPGAILSPMNQAWADDPKARAEVESHIPVGRAGTPEEIAAVFAFLASDDASYVTGQTVYACGGLTLYADFRTDWATGGA